MKLLDLRARQSKRVDRVGRASARSRAIARLIKVPEQAFFPRIPT